MVDVDAISRAVRAELASHRAESEQSLRHELELLRESIVNEIKAEVRLRRLPMMRKQPPKVEAEVEGPVSTSASVTVSRDPRRRASGVEQMVPKSAEAPPAEEAVPGTEAWKPLLVQGPGSTSVAVAEAAAPEQGFLAKIVTSPRFDSAASLLVFLSAIFLAVQTDYTARHFVVDPPYSFHCVESGFCMIFVLEIILRLCVYGRDFFTDKNKYWNIFDLSLVSVQVMELVAATLNTGKRLPFAPFLRILRIARIVRVARFLRLVPELRTLIVQIFHSFLPLTWVLILVFLVTAVFAVVLTQVVTDYKVEHMEEYKSEEMEHLHMFDNLLMSMFALYQTISEGKHWGELSEPLMEIHPSLALLFVGYTFFVIFAFMNVVTSHFVEEAIESAQQDERQQMLENLEDVFGTNKDSTTQEAELDEQQFLELCETHGMQEYLKHLYQRHDVSKAEVKQMKLFQILDLDGSGQISTDELVQGCNRLTRAPTVLDLAVFRQYCTDFFLKLEDVLVGDDARHTAKSDQ